MEEIWLQPIKCSTRTGRRLKFCLPDGFLIKDVIRLKEVEDMVEVYYNSGMFDKTIAELVQRMKHPFRLFEHLADYYKEHGYQEVNHTKLARYEILYDFMKEVHRANWIGCSDG